MEKLSKNAERIWKVLSQFPEGTSAKQVMQITAMGHSWVYNGLKELVEKGFVRHESSLWIPKAKEETSTGTKPKETTLELLWKKQFFKHEDRVMRVVNNKDSDNLANAPEAALNYLQSDLPSELKEKLPGLKELERKIKWVYKQQGVDSYTTLVLRCNLLEDIALIFVPKLYGKALDLVLKA